MRLRIFGWRGLGFLVAALTAVPAASYQDLGSMGRKAVAIAESEDVWASDPIYEESSDTYFQFFRDFRTNRHGMRWEEARLFASRARYNGRKGRLVIIDTPEKYEAIISNFPLQYVSNNYTWIGLRYWCLNRRLQWVDGGTPGRSAFSVWHAQWFRNPQITCSNSRINYMPVYLDGATLRWQASGQAKRFPHYIVEFPPIATAERN
ncbi:MAG: C-type lectin domain-containing protein [Rhodothalassiaceae bacterium]